MSNRMNTGVKTVLLFDTKGNAIQWFETQIISNCLLVISGMHPDRNINQ